METRDPYAWVFIKFPAGFWEDPAKMRDEASWEIVKDRKEAERKAIEYGLNFDYLWDTSDDKTVRMIKVDEKVEDLDVYAKEYCDDLARALEEALKRSGCFGGMLAGGVCGCGCGSSSDSCKCGCCD